METGYQKVVRYDHLGRASTIVVAMNIMCLYSFAVLQMIMINFMLGLPPILSVSCLLLNIACVIFFQIKLVSFLFRKVCKLQNL